MGEVADYVLDRLRGWGIHRIYGYPGDGINGFLGAFGRAAGDPEFIQARHEEMAAFMATAHAKFTGQGCSVRASPRRCWAARSSPTTCRSSPGRSACWDPSPATRW